MGKYLHCVIYHLMSLYILLVHLVFYSQEINNIWYMEHLLHQRDMDNAPEVSRKNLEDIKVAD